MKRRRREAGELGVGKRFWKKPGGRRHRNQGRRGTEFQVELGRLSMSVIPLVWVFSGRYSQRWTPAGRFGVEWVEWRMGTWRRVGVNPAGARRPCGWQGARGKGIMHQRRVTAVCVPPLSQSAQASAAMPGGASPGWLYWGKGVNRAGQRPPLQDAEIWGGDILRVCLLEG